MLYHTTNETTQKCGQAVATVIVDSTKNGKRITTFELVYPRYIHSEVMTYRMFSRNASSSRATPLAVTLDEVRNDPVFFDRVGKNKSGMVAGALLSPTELAAFEHDWNELADTVADSVEMMSSKYGIHKQVLNRALEPFLRIRTLVTATDWTNFFNQRLAPDAQPEINSLAVAMKEAMKKSVPTETELHIPYITAQEADLNQSQKIQVSVARCARVSYGKLEQKLSSVDDDALLYKRLLDAKHLSPFEHIAFAANYAYRNTYYANFCGWRSYRNQLGY